MSVRVLLFSKYPRQGASSRLRSFQYLPFLNDQGVEVVVSPLFDKRYLELLYETGQKPRFHSVLLYLRRLWAFMQFFRYDVVWIEYELLPYIPAFGERLLKLFSRPYVVDYDDAVFHNYDLSGNRWVRRLLGRKIYAVMRNASAVIAGNQYLADRARQAEAERVVVIPTVVDRLRYQPQFASEDEDLVIGWIGSPSTQRYVVGIGDALARVCRETGARLVLVGATPSVTDELPGTPVEVVPWSEDSEAELVSRMSVGIMPLEDGPWEQGKCGYKLIQYMACAVPVVASPVGVNTAIVGDNRCGLLADSSDDWSTSLLSLLGSRERRVVLGQAGRHAVDSHYSLQVQAPILRDVLVTACHRKQKR